MRTGRRAPRGFTLIEALVAMVIVGGAGMALFTWINASIVSVRRVEAANERSDAMANAIEYMQAVNPMTAPEGRAQLGSYEIAWASVPLTAATTGAGYPQGPSQFQLALYDTQVRAARPGDRNWFDFRLVLVGHRRFGEPGKLFP